MTVNLKTLAIGLMAGAMALSTGLVAAEITYWSPNAASPTREFKTSTGKLVSWDFAGGVKFTDDAGLAVTVARDSVVAVRRDETDRTPELQNAVLEGNVGVLARIATSGKDEFEKEDALQALAEARYRGRDAAGAANAWRDYLKAYPRGNFALDARVFIATSLLTGDNVPAARVQEAEKMLEEAASLGGELAKARASMLLGKSMLARKEAKAAVEKFTTAATSAAAIQHHEFNIQSLVGAGEAAQATGDTAGAKAKFAEALKVPMTSEYNRTEMGHARGAAHIGLATIAGNTLEGYQSWLAASCWFIGQPREGECLIKALGIAEKQQEKDAATWAERAKQVRESCRKVAANALLEYDKTKGQ